MSTTAETKNGSSFSIGQMGTPGNIADIVRRNNEQILETQERNRRLRELLKEVGAEAITPVGIVQKLYPEERPRILQGVSNVMVTASGVKRWAGLKAVMVSVITFGPLLASLIGGIWAYHLGLTTGWRLAGMITGGFIWLGFFSKSFEKATHHMACVCSVAICNIVQYKGVVPNDGVLCIQKLQAMPDLIFHVATRAGKHTVTKARPRDPLLLAQHTGTGEFWLLEAWEEAANS